MAAINFFNEDVSFHLPNKAIIKKWLKTAANVEGFSIEELNYIFTSDDYLLQVNREYLNHDTLTDIITFDNSEQDGRIEGDIFISVARVQENALKFKEPFERELCRVLIHGLLHLMGYKDDTIGSKKEIREKENAYLSLLPDVPRGTAPR
jgi:probable rRNA maturation factor